MSVIDVAAALREILVSEAPDTAAVSVSADTLVSETAAGNPSVGAVLVYREILVADRPETITYHASAEALVAEQPARDIPLMTTLVMREVLAYEGIAFVQSAGREVTLSLPDDPLTVHALLTHASSAALQQREYLHPAAYISDEYVGVFRQQVSLAKPSILLWSPTRVSRFAQLVARSRTRTFEPIAAIRVPQQRQLALQARTVQAQIGFPQVRATVSLVAASTPREIPPTANWSYQVRELAAQERLYGPIEGDRAVGKLVQLSAALRVTEPPFTQGFVAALAQLGAAARDAATPLGPVNVGRLLQLSALGRPVVEAYGPPIAGQHVELASVGLVLELIESARDVGTTCQMTSVALQLPPPSAVTGVTYGLARQLSSAYRALPLAGDMRSPLYAAQAAVQYALGRDTLPPDQVENPEIGCHVRQYLRLSAQFRPYPPPPPPEGGAIRVSQVAAGAVLRDRTFPAPPFPPEEVFATVRLLWQTAVLIDREFLPQSYLQVPAIEQRVTLGDPDGWVDPTLPTSDVRVQKLAGLAVLGDTSLPPAGQPQSVPRVLQIPQTVLLGDTSLPPAGQPQSVPRVFAGLEWVVLADVGLPTGPQSVVRAGQVGQHCTLHDRTLVGMDAVSQILCTSIVETAVLRDKTLQVLPGRRNRPVATITMI